MRKVILSCMAVMLSMTSFAQTEFGLFNHLAVGLNGGTTGVGVDLAAPINNHFQLRAGVSLLPFTVNEDIDIEGYYPDEVANQLGSLNLPGSIEVEGKLKMNNAKVLLDFYPSKHSSFHLTAGAYIGGSEIVTLTNAQEGALNAVTQANNNIQQWNQQYGTNFSQIGVEIGDYLLTSDSRGNFTGSFKTRAVKPYLGLGFGRAVPKHAVGFMFEMGAMFWGSPGVYCNGEQLVADKVGGDEGEVLKLISKLSVYPVMNFRLCFRAF